ncbi:MAG TPA: tetratricopeptide repeat protein, partial [Cyanophyceae cyanobacterium]
VANYRPILALRTFQQALERWPHHPKVDDINKTIAELQPAKAKIIEEIGLSEKDSLELATLHETSQTCIEQGEYAQGRQALEHLLQIRPDSIPDLNNLSLICFLESDLEGAIATAQRTLDLDPNNIHALSNLIRYRCLSGQFEEAKQLAEQIKTVASDHPDSWVKKAEALSYLGDDQGILDVFQAASQLDSEEINPLLYHLAGVAAMRLGQDKQARQYWQQALKLDRRFELSQENLADSQNLIGQRHAPWAFNLNSWITPQAFRDLSILVEGDRAQDKSFSQESAQRYLQQHPEVAALIPILLDRGDLQGRQLALSLAIMANTPEMQLVLRDFALSQRGPDPMRTQAAQVVSQSGLFPPGLVRMWLEGEWRDIMLLGFELHDEPSRNHSPQVEKLSQEAVIAFKQGKAEKSQQLLKQALKLEPDASDLLYNLAGTYERQGHPEEAFEMIRQLHEKDPDYLFARTGLAQIHISNGELEEAEALLQPLASRKRFHYSEFDAFCSAQIDLYLAQKNSNAARSWLDMWAMTNPDTPAIDYWRSRLDKKRQTQHFVEEFWEQNQ